MLFTQSRPNETSGTSKDFSSSKSSTIPKSKVANFERPTCIKTLPSSMKKKSLPKRSITFSDLPPTLRKSSDCIVQSPCKVKSTIIEQPIQSLQKTPANTLPPNFTQKPVHTRFQLPPTPLTASECWGNLDTSASLSKRQIARSVDGNFQVEVGFQKHVQLIISTNIYVYWIYCKMQVANFISNIARKLSTRSNT